MPLKDSQMFLILASTMAFFASASIFFTSTNLTYLADNVWAAYGLMIMACWLIFLLSVALTIIGATDRTGQLRAPASLAVLLSWILLLPQAGFAIGGLLNYQSGLDIMLALSKAYGVEARFVGDGLIVLDGMIGLGTFESLYEQYIWNDVRMVQLTSGGGLLEEAKKIAVFVREKEIAIWVNSSCESACVIIALASPDIYVAPNALFGFHRGSAVGSPDSELGRFIGGAATEDYMAQLKRLGVPHYILKKVQETRPDDMHYVTGRELFDIGLADHLAE
jgi:hypothetical protein